VLYEQFDAFLVILDVAIADNRFVLLR